MAEKSLVKMFEEGYEARTINERARFVAEKLEGAVRYRRLFSPNKSGSEYDMNMFDAAVMEKAGALLAILETEAWRQREAIKLFLHGQIDRHALKRIADTWNGDN